MNNKKGLCVEYIDDYRADDNQQAECLHGETVNGLQDRAKNALEALREAVSETSDYGSLINDEVDYCKELSQTFAAWEHTLDELDESAVLLLKDEPESSNSISRSRQDHKVPAHREPARTNTNKRETERYEKQLLDVIQEQNDRILGLESKLGDLKTKRGGIKNQIEVVEHSMPIQNDDESCPKRPEEPCVNRLIVVERGDQTLKIPLTRNIMTIGRETENDINIRSRFISRFHARIVTDQSGCTIEDLDSCNGLLVNSEKVGRKQLRSGDRINLGRIQLKYIDLMDADFSEGQA